ncbi:spore germination protein [Bacillus sp. FJAT-44742]|uniref:spore germination protein n=1 Tax=Bacillus sp. FJAT-44742 TaxID=2014005 RepID=UPI000C24EE61|nr:spore germination protein [Bacillus sp. FJAT-44742]
MGRINIRVNNMSDNSSINFGNTVHEEQQAFEKSQGGNLVVGDRAKLVAKNKNKLIDPDGKDMTNIEVTFDSNSKND